MDIWERRVRRTTVILSNRVLDVMNVDRKEPYAVLEANKRKFKSESIYNLVYLLGRLLGEVGARGGRRPTPGSHEG